jgi:translation elongation factor EF-4
MYIIISVHINMYIWNIISIHIFLYNIVPSCSRAGEVGYFSANIKAVDHIYIYIYIYIYVYIYIDIHIFIFTYKHIHIHLNVFKNVYRAGEVGYFSANIKAVDHARVGKSNISILICIFILIYHKCITYYCLSIATFSV